MPAVPQNRARKSRSAPPGKPQQTRSAPTPARKSVKAVVPTIDVDTRVAVEEIANMLRKLKIKSDSLESGRQQHGREMVVRVFAQARRLKDDPDFLSAYRILAPELGVTRPPKDPLEVYRIFLRDAYETPKMGSWAFVATKELFNSNLSPAEVGQLVKEHGIEKAAEVAGIVPPAPKDKDWEGASDRPVPKRPAPGGATPPSKPAPQPSLEAAASTGVLPPSMQGGSPPGKPASAQPASGGVTPGGKPRPMSAVRERAEVVQDDGSWAICRISGNEGLMEGQKIEVLVERISGTAPERIIEGSWNVSY